MTPPQRKRSGSPRHSSLWAHGSGRQGWAVPGPRPPGQSAPDHRPSRRRFGTQRGPGARQAWPHASPAMRVGGRAPHACSLDSPGSAAANEEERASSAGPSGFREPEPPSSPRQQRGRRAVPGAVQAAARPARGPGGQHWGGAPGKASPSARREVEGQWILEVSHWMLENPHTWGVSGGGFGLRLRWGA